MELILGPLASFIAAMSFALALMALVAALAVFAGLYYSAPRVVSKWLSRRALRHI